jgi:hypothetical protein
MTTQSNDKTAIDELLERQEADGKSYDIRTELFLAAVHKAIAEADGLQLFAAKNMALSFVASASMFEQKWLRQREGLNLDDASLRRVAALSALVSACTEKLSLAIEQAN